MYLQGTYSTKTWNLHYSPVYARTRLLVLHPKKNPDIPRFLSVIEERAEKWLCSLLARLPIIKF